MQAHDDDNSVTQNKFFWLIIRVNSTDAATF